MELMAAGSLDDLTRKKKFSVNETIHIMLQSLDAVSYAHRMDKVHRDLDPTNILFTNTGCNVKVDPNGFSAVEHQVSPASLRARRR